MLIHMNNRDTRVYTCISRCTLLAVSIAFGALPLFAASAPTYANKMDLGQQLLFNGDVDRAIRAFEAAAELNPKSPDPHTMLLNLYMQKGGDGALEKSIREAHAILERKPGTKDMHMVLGSLLRNQAGVEADPAKQKAEIDEAIKELGAAEAAGSKRSQCEYTIGMMLLQRGDNDEAREHLEAALKDQPDFADAHMVHAILTFRQITKPPADGKPVDSASPEFKHRIKDVLDELDLSIKQKGKNAEAWNTKAEIQLSAGDVDGASQSYSHATQDDPKHFAAWMGYGNCQATLAGKETDTSKQAEHLKKASDAFQNAKKVNPNDKNAVSSLGVVYEKLGQYADAVAEYESYLMMETDLAAKAGVQQHVQQIRQQLGMPVMPGMMNFGGGAGALGGMGGIGGIGTGGSTMFTGGALAIPMQNLIKPPEDPKDKNSKDKN
jgi:tetratricopeptide (TPR) repeat protein